jgi:hypothetical protein
VTFPTDRNGQPSTFYEPLSVNYFGGGGTSQSFDPIVPAPGVHRVYRFNNMINLVLGQPIGTDVGAGPGTQDYLEINLAVPDESEQGHVIFGVFEPKK